MFTLRKHLVNYGRNNRTHFSFFSGTPLTGKFEQRKLGIYFMFLSLPMLHYCCRSETLMYLFTLDRGANWTDSVLLGACSTRASFLVPSFESLPKLLPARFPHNQLKSCCCCCCCINIPFLQVEVHLLGLKGLLRTFDSSGRYVLSHVMCCTTDNNSFLAQL